MSGESRPPLRPPTAGEAQGAGTLKEKAKAKLGQGNFNGAAVVPNDALKGPLPQLGITPT